MINTCDFFYLGKIVKTHGVHGMLNGFIDADNPESYSELKSVFIKTKQGIFPYIFEKISINSKGFCSFKLKGVDTIEKAKKLAGKEIYLPLSELPQLTGNNFYFHEIINFDVSDKKYGIIGKITGVIEHTVQPLIQIEYQSKEILLPVHDDIIIKVDRIAKILFVSAPDGLIDLYIK